MKKTIAFCFFILSVAVVFLFSSLAQAGVVEQLARLSQELDAIEKQAQEILQHQDETLAKISELKIRAHRT